MTVRHLMLLFLWMIFCLLHTLFATDKFKLYMQAILKKKYRFYKLAYSLFAVVTLVIVLGYNYRVQSFNLWNVSLTEKIIAITGLAISSFLMLLFTRKFFFELSGADVFQKQKVSRELLQTNFYKYVRHPLYTATLIFVWNIFLLKPSLSNLISCICISAYTIFGISLEEKKLLIEFGESYKSYRSKTPMLFPKIFIK